MEVKKFIETSSTYGANGDVTAFESKIDLKFWWYPCMETSEEIGAGSMQIIEDKIAKRKALSRQQKINNILKDKAYKEAFNGMSMGRYCGSLLYVDYNGSEPDAIVFKGFWTIQ